MTDAITAKAVEYVRAMARDERPFFLYVAQVPRTGRFTPGPRTSPAIGPPTATVGMRSARRGTAGRSRWGSSIPPRIPCHR